MALEFSSEIDEAAALARRCAGPVAAGESVKGLIRRVAMRTGLPPGRVKGIWYREARQIRAEEMDALRRRARLARQEEDEARGEYRSLAERLARIETLLDSFMAHSRGPDGAARCAMDRGVDRPLD